MGVGYCRQDAFRARNDDGSDDDTSATWIAAKDTDWTQAVDENFRIRILAQEYNGFQAKNYYGILQFRYDSTGTGSSYGSWTNVLGASSILQSSASSNRTDGDDTDSDQLGGSGTQTDNNNAGFDEANGANGSGFNDIPANGHFEGEWNILIVGADVVDGGLLQLKDATCAAFNIYPTITIDKGGPPPTILKGPPSVHLRR
jgi:hypothetical protein